MRTCFALTIDILSYFTQQRTCNPGSTHIHPKRVFDIHRYFAVAVGRQVQVWRTPGASRKFNAFVKYRDYALHYDDVTCVNWSSDSQVSLLIMNI
jgi:hypothetical protein